MNGDGGTEPDPGRVRVGIAEYAVSTSGETLVTSGLGSCLGVALFDGDHGVAGLAHVMLPETNGTKPDNLAKYADTGITELVRTMVHHGADARNMTAKLAGGSDMFEFSAAGDQSIGERNGVAARATLDDLDVPVVAEDVGGDYGRSLQFIGTTGELVVKSAKRGTTTL